MPRSPRFIPSDPELGGVNQARWNALSRAGVEFARPYLELDEAQAWHFLDEDGLLDDPTGRQVLVLAGGGGQQTACFALLGAEVTVLDLSDEQLERDREAVAAHGFAIRLEHGDMRDLSRFEADAFDIVYHPHSINFLPSVDEVFTEVVRVLRPQGQYRVDLHNPFTQLVDDGSFDEKHGFSLRHPYRDGEVDLTGVFGSDQWGVPQENGTHVSIDHPRSWVHTLGTVAGALARHQLVLEGVGEELAREAHPEPGSWEHFKQVTVPYLRFWTRRMPDAFRLRGTGQRRRPDPPASQSLSTG